MALTQISTQGIKDGTITGSDLATNVDLVDNQRLRLGTGNDLQIYHDGTRSHILNSTDELRIRGNDVRLMNAAGNEHYFVGFANSYSAMYFDNSKKFETTANGVLTTGNIQLDSDSGKLTVGDSGDFEVYHDGSNTYLDNLTGALYIRNNVNNDENTNIYLQAKIGEEGIIIHDDGPVELYYDGARVFETDSGSVKIRDNIKANFGTGNDLQIYHTGSHSIIRDTGTGNLQIAGSFIQFTNEAITSTGLTFAEGGAVELYFNNSLRLSTTANGVTLGHNLFLDNATNAGRDVIWDPANDQLQWKDNTKASFGNNSDLQIYHDGSHSFIEESGTGNLTIKGSSQININNAADTENCAIFKSDGAVELYFDGSLKFKTDSIGCEIAGALIIPDGSASSNRISVGNAGDLKIFHDGTDSKITNTTGALDINGSGNINIGKAGENGIKVRPDDAVELYYDNSKKLNTDSTGVSINGRIHTQLGTNHNSFNKTTTGKLVSLMTDGTERGNISSNGSTVQFNTTASDKSLKKNFEDWTENTLNLFKNINAQKFNFLDQEDGTDKEKGFIAQDMVVSFPEAYQKNDDDKYMFNPSGMVVYLMKAIQELEAEVAALKAG